MKCRKRKKTGIKAATNKSPKPSLSLGNECSSAGQPIWQVNHDFHIGHLTEENFHKAEEQIDASPAARNEKSHRWFRIVFSRIEDVGATGRRNLDTFMDQKLEGTPKASLQLAGRKVTRSEITNHWGTRLQWKVSRDGKEVAAVTAGVEPAFEHADTVPGKYEIVLQQFQYVSYAKDKDGKFTASKYVDISEPVTYTV